ncbi:SDR family NAD(P)-dependent oxidoreductase [Shouchella miscanthi]|uniref:SDR family NAD(P)-dependent oxidoreductase n=1 Tax=Shouchella miscanthi TaxID=2598861 RepID=UPI0011A08515|nr:SDR family NAD(P)-dependent oxidoreductase [Shouchella miscanthi]
MRIAIVIGSSKGLGAAVVKQLLEEQYEVIGFSRTEAPKEIHTHPSFTHVPFDASHVATRQDIFSNVFASINVSLATEMLFIYNAALINPVGRLGTLEKVSFSQQVEVNLVAPLELSNLFIQSVQSLTISKRMLFVTSGVASKPISGWSGYSSSKAGLNMIVHSIAKEQEDASSPVLVAGFNPGIMDTTMQQTIRHFQENQFPSVAQFKRFHESGRLQPASIVARSLIRCLQNPTFANGQIVRVDDYL